MAAIMAPVNPHLLKPVATNQLSRSAQNLPIYGSPRAGTQSCAEKRPVMRASGNHAFACFSNFAKLSLAVPVRYPAPQNSKRSPTGRSETPFSSTP